MCFSAKIWLQNSIFGLWVQMRQVLAMSHGHMRTWTLKNPKELKPQRTLKNPHPKEPVTVSGPILVVFPLNQVVLLYFDAIYFPLDLFTVCWLFFFWHVWLQWIASALIQRPHSSLQPCEELRIEDAFLPQQLAISLCDKSKSQSLRRQWILVECWSATGQGAN